MGLFQAIIFDENTIVGCISPTLSNILIPHIFNGRSMPDYQEKHFNF